MSYTISLRIYQTNTNAFFRVVESAVWYEGGGGTWGLVRDEHVLTVGGTGTAGALRLESEDTGEALVVALGMHEHKRWCDMVVGVSPRQTAGLVVGEYFGHVDMGDRSFMRTKQGTRHEVSSGGRHYTVAYTVTEGRNLRANLVIG